MQLFGTAWVSADPRAVLLWLTMWAVACSTVSGCDGWGWPGKTEVTLTGSKPVS